MWKPSVSRETDHETPILSPSLHASEPRLWVPFHRAADGDFHFMRIRTIKPTFWTNDELAELHPLTRLLFIGLWCLADVRGRLEDRPKRIKAAVIPYDDHDVDEALEQLAKAGFLIRYSVGNLGVIQVTNFEKHQRITGKEAETESDFPASDCEGARVRTGKQRGTTGETPGSPEGKEGKGKEGREEEGKGELPLGESPNATSFPAKTLRMAKARPVLAVLNEVSGRKFRETEANLLLIASRLEEPDVTVEGCIAMVRRQAAKWLREPHMAEFLRPETLFGKQKFDGYYAARDLPIPAIQANGQRQPLDRTPDDAAF